MKYPPILTAFLFALTSCDRDKKPAETAVTEGAAAATNRIEIPAIVRSNIGITFAKVERRQVADTLRVPGSFELKPLAKHEYRLLLPQLIYSFWYHNRISLHEIYL
jgi:hypothetical protein